MTERCWEELRRAGKALDEEPYRLPAIVADVAGFFELPHSPEAEAVQVFLDAELRALEERHAVEAEE
jgi:hypothetical protein